MFCFLRMDFLSCCYSFIHLLLLVLIFSLFSFLLSLFWIKAFLTLPSGANYNLTSSISRSTTDTTIYTFSTSTLTTVGTYTLSLTLEGLPIAGSPLQFVVEYGNPSTFTTSGPGASAATLEISTFFFITGYDIYGNALPNITLNVSLIYYSKKNNLSIQNQKNTISFFILFYFIHYFISFYYIILLYYFF